MGRDGPGIRPISQSSIEVHFMYRGIRCRERLPLEPTKSNLAYARRLKGEIENAIGRGTFDYARFFPDSPRAVKFALRQGDLVNVATVLRDHIVGAKAELQRSTWLDYRNSVENILIPAFGHLKLNELSKARIKAWAGTLTVSRKRLYNVLAPLRSALADNDLIDHNPLKEWTPGIKGKVQDSKAEPDPFKLDEIKALLNACIYEPMRNLIQFGCWTGLRIEELIEVRWTDVAWETPEIKILRARCRGEVKPPKTERGKRRVKLLSPALEALTTQRQHTALRHGYIFLNPRTDKPWIDDNQLRKAFKQIVKRACVRYRPPAQMRHTYASIMVSTGEDTRWVASQMGHADLNMVGRVYARWIPELSPDAGSKAEAFWKA